VVSVVKRDLFDWTDGVQLCTRTNILILTHTHTHTHAPITPSSPRAYQTAYGEAKEHLSHMLIDKTIQETDKYNFYYGLAASTLTNTVALIVLYSLWTYAEPGYQVGVSVWCSLTYATTHTSNGISFFCSSLSPPPAPTPNLLGI
jgi:hypothetical protein